MPTSTDAVPNTIRVKLIKQRHGGLGFLIKQRTHKPLVVVADLVAGGIAEESGLVQVGDIILRLNDINLSEMSYESAVEVLKAVPMDAPVVLLLRGPEGYTTHLETTFLENGVPKTVRVTKAIQESIVGRIRRTFSSSNGGAPSPVKTLKKICRGDGNSDDSLTHKEGEKPNGSAAGINGGGAGGEIGIDLIDSDGMACVTSGGVGVGGVTGSADSGYSASVANGGDGSSDSQDVVASSSSSSSSGRQKAAGETVLDNGAMGSPKIVLTSPRVQQNRAATGGNGPRSSSATRKAIEIVQDNDEITVVVKGDVRIQSEVDNSAPDTPKRFIISSKYPTPAAAASSRPASAQASSAGPNQTSPDKNGHLQPKDPGSPESQHHHHHHHLAESDVSDSEDGRERSRGTPKKGSPSPARRSSDRRGSLVSPKRFAKLRNLLDEKTSVDVLHQKVTEVMPCSQERCMGSLMGTQVKTGAPRKGEELLGQAKDFIEQYFTSIKRLNTAAYQKRWQEVLSSIERTGTYDLTREELVYGAKTAWRNAPRCIGRIQWSKLQVFDARHITTARGMYEALCNHIKYGTNKGNLRSAITIFPQRSKSRGDYRVWNAQLISYAGYRQPDGSIIGDPKTVEFTEIVMKMGWKPKTMGPFNVLPLVLSAGGQDPELFEIPPELVLEINLKHPKYPWFGEMGLKWYGLPAVAAMLFDCGGLEFTACPFNGWYMGTEIGARDLCDSSRYNVLEKVAVNMGLDIRKSSSLWKDRALVEVNIAVLHSYQAAGVTITDHHAASDSFMKHLENEQRLRGGCPADWVWVVPPMSGSITPVFHQEMLLYKLKPSYEYMEDPWKTHVWKKDRDKPKNQERSRRKFGFRELARAVKFSAKLMGRALARRVKCTILYATETGKSERFANTLCEIFKHAFDARVVCMDTYDVIQLEHESLVLVVTSTFGNGDPPENGESLAKALYEMKHPEKSGSANFSSSSYIRMSVSSESDGRECDKEANEDDNLTMESGPLGNVRYSVFSLGSRAYPHFAAFGHYMDKILTELGAECIHATVEGDELCGQEESFRNWAESVFSAACETFCLGDDINISEATGALSNTDHSWTPNRFRITPIDNAKDADVCQALCKLHGKTVLPCKLVERMQLQSTDSTRQTILAKLNTQDSAELQYEVGDHVGIFPANPADLVDAILSRLHNAPPPDQVIKTEFLQENSTALGSSKNWTQVEKMPVCSMRTALAHFLDVTTPPSQAFLQLMATLTSRDIDKERLELLAKDSKAYEDWRYDLYPNLLEVLDQFPSLKVPPSLLMTQLPMLQQRFYSISSSPMECVGEIHATVAVVKYRTQNGTGPVHEGVCSGWMNRCDVGSIIPCAVRAAHSFRLPEDQTLPVIMVGPGTGIAPFRSFWQQRKVDMDMKSVPSHGQRKGWGEMYLYFGCRRNSVDNIYRDELAQMKEEKVLTDYYVALSREPDQSKVYVQDILFKNAAVTYEAVVKRGGHFYVCGDVSMANDVTKTLEQILAQHGALKGDQAKNFVLKLKDANRFHEDIFGVSLQRTSEAGDSNRDQSHRAWQFIDAPSKPSSKEVAKPMPLPDTKKMAVGKPKVPMKNIFMKKRVGPGSDSSESSPTHSASSTSTLSSPK